MKTVIGVLCVILAAQSVTAQCPMLRTFTTELKPACDINDIYIKWPNYANQSTYYTCFGVGNPVLTPCPSGDYFTYVYQQCNQCSEYIPPPICENLKTQDTPNCVPIGSGSNNSPTPTITTGYPTPHYPSTNTAATASTNTMAPTVITPPTVSPTSAPTNTAYPGPPSPVTSAPNVPTPPTQAATPPVIDLTPPGA
ncbi:PREDICTED: peritrophin-55 [Bactrocera latifrons]|nr:PREDICTED: peritrophin-55 [Bactrocera latifrons]